MISVDFGFLFAQVIRFYGLSFEQVRSLPLGSFWFLSNKIDRIRAEETIWQLQTVASATSAESYKTSLADLRSLVGTVVVLKKPAVSTLDLNDTEEDPAFDRAALQSLKFSLSR